MTRIPQLLEQPQEATDDPSWMVFFDMHCHLGLASQLTEFLQLL